MNLLRGAAYICTDSFHGSCFSIIHRKNFATFNRYSEQSRHSKNSRIDSLCSNLGLEDRRYDSSLPLATQLNKEINYESVVGKFEALKEETNSYLNKAFENLE